MGKTFKALVKTGKGADMAAPLVALAAMAAGPSFSRDDIESVKRSFEKLENDLIDAKNVAI